MGKSVCTPKRDNNGQTAPESDQGCPTSELRYQDMTSVAHIDAIIRYSEGLLDIRFNSVKKNRYNAICPFHAGTGDSLMVYVNKNDEVRFHCFGACKGDWDIYAMIMLRKKCRLRQAQKIWAEHLGVRDFKYDDGGSPCIPEPDETPEPDDTVCFIEPKKIDEKMVATLNDAAKFYNELLRSNEDRFGRIWDYLARRGVEMETVRKFNIGYSPPYSDDQHRGRALIDNFFQRFGMDYAAFDTFSESGLTRLLNDESVKGYGYYSRQIDFTWKDPFSKNYGDCLAGRIVFPVYDPDANPTGFVGRNPDDGGVRRLRHRTGEVPLSAGSRLYGIEKAKRYIRQYRTIILVEGIFDYFAFYNLLQNQDKAVVVSTLGSYLTPGAANILRGLEIKHFIVAYDWDAAGRNGIERVASKSGGWVYYLGDPADGQSPYDVLKPIVNSISGLSLKRLKTDRPVPVRGREKEF